MLRNVCLGILICATAWGEAYRLGPDDRVLILARSADEFPKEPIRVDDTGWIELPLAGRIQAAGKTTVELKNEIAERLKTYIREPEVLVSIQEFRARPVSVGGAVVRPGILQIRGPKTLSEAIVEAGGLAPEAGETLTISRPVKSGELPLANARTDVTGSFQTATVSLRSLREMVDARENVELMEGDSITVAKADVVYVVGQVARPGGFATNGSVSILEALSLAGGYQPDSKSKSASLLRAQAGTDERQVIPVNLNRILEGKDEDIPLRAEDILYVPHSAWKGFGRALLESASAAASSALIYSLIWNNNR